MSLPALARTDRLLLAIVLVGAVLAALIGWLVLPPEKTGGMAEEPSTFFNAAYGTKAAYQVLARLDYRVSRLRRPIASETLRGVGVLFILVPQLGLMDHEVTALEKWVREGHGLVVAPGGPGHGAPRKGGRSGDNVLQKWFELAKLPKHKPEQIDTPMRPKAAEPLTAGIAHLVAGNSRRFKPDAPLAGPLAKMPAHPFWSDKLGLVGLRVELGRGTVIGLADTYALSNLGLSDADNGLFLGNMVGHLSGRYPGRIAFDEYHLGFAERDWSPVAVVKLMVTGPWRWAVAQAILVGLLALWAGAVRFGSARDPTRKPRREHREFAEAAGRLLDEAGATSLAAATLYRDYRERLCRLVDLEPDADDRRLAQAVLGRTGQEISPLLDRAAIAVRGPVGRRELLSLAQKLHRIMEALEHGT